ncbi:MAG: Do family serine endopeptidase [Spirochaetes bacterium]|nr:MAG: Do family serine endopeptidase [Spirochaetota bacterium]
MSKKYLVAAVCFAAALGFIPASAADKNDQALKKFNDQIIEITKKAVPMVVNISALKEAPHNDVYEYDNQGRQEKKFPFKPPVEPRASGSGVIVDKRGYIITNYHVIKDTRAIKITLSDRREFPCSVMGTDPATDIAIIKIDGAVPADLPVIQLGDSDKLEVGEVVIAIGNPFGFTHTVTMGIVSATGRQSVGLADYENFIQTDAAINPGNSGGALINIDGNLVGINTAIFSKTGGYMGIGFAIPTSMIKEILSELITKGKVVRGWLGVFIQDVTKDMADSFKYKGEGGALVSDIMKGAPAEGSGIRKGDIITSVDGIKIRDINHLRRLIAGKKPGATVKLSVYRDAKDQAVNLTVGTLPDKTPVAESESQENGDEIGITVREIDEDLAYKFRSTEKRGVMITQVKRGSPADRAGLIAGDIIKEIERAPIDTAKSYADAVETLKEKKKLLFLISRGGTHKFIVIEKEEK